MKMKKNLIDYELLWEKITDYVKATSRTTARPVLLLYYVLRSPETPSSDKMLIVAHLFISINQRYRFINPADNW